jgi:hypothetical protein
MGHMDYDEFKKEYDTFTMWSDDIINPKIVKRGADVIKIGTSYNTANDMVNSPAHYTRGSQEVIDIIEQAISDAPSNAEGYLQGQALKYLLRVWLKDNPKQDCEKAVWYLNRLINKLD